METMYTMFVLGMVMSSLMATPAIVAMGYANAWRKVMLGREPGYRPVIKN
ncbi:MAG: hypothetical protein LBR05_11365 [Azoarcus sp.]|nr:hypothetical protein [Azoarcus sp.]